MDPCQKCGKLKKAYCRQMCRACYALDRRHSTTRSLQECPSCCEMRPHQAKGLCATCYVRSVRAKHPGSDSAHARKHNLKSKYGLTLERYDEMLAEQHGVCAICGADASNARSKRLAVDHDHVTGKVRGLLCQRCNLALGYVGDSPERAEALAAYLRRHAAR